MKESNLKIHEASLQRTETDTDTEDRVPRAVGFVVMELMAPHLGSPLQAEALIPTPEATALQGLIATMEAADRFSVSDYDRPTLVR